MAGVSPIRRSRVRWKTGPSSGSYRWLATLVPAGMMSRVSTWEEGSPPIDRTISEKPDKSSS